jgi:frataxin-like iron-binding protein CyaY
MHRKLLNPFYTLCHTLPEALYLHLASRKIAELTEIAEQTANQEVDCTATDKILTISSPLLSIVINTQLPNRQIWHSSTASGPQRFDYDQKAEVWRNGIGKKIEEVLINDLKIVI